MIIVAKEKDLSPHRVRDGAGIKRPYLINIAPAMQR